MRAFDITTHRVDTTTATQDMTEKVTLGRLGSTAATVTVVVFDVVGGITHLRGLSLSPLNELS